MSTINLFCYSVSNLIQNYGTAANPTYVTASFKEKTVLYAGPRSPVLFLYRCNFKILRKPTCITANPIVIEIGISKIIVSIIFDRSSLQKTVKDCCTKKAQSTQNKDSIDTNIPILTSSSFCDNLP